MHDVDTAVLRTFLALVETGSFSRAGVLVVSRSWWKFEGGVISG